VPDDSSPIGSFASSVEWGFTPQDTSFLLSKHQDAQSGPGYDRRTVVAVSAEKSMTTPLYDSFSLSTYCYFARIANSFYRADYNFIVLAIFFTNHTFRGNQAGFSFG
jgi:hypothetical protein